MKTTHRRTIGPIQAICAMLVAAPLWLASPAHADEYADVNQLVRAGKLADALTKIDQFLQGKPKDPQMRFIKGVVQSESGKAADAISTFTKLTEDFPELPEPYNNLAVLYASQNQLDKARTALEMAIRTNPSYTTAHENLGDVYAKLASQAYSKALQLDANNTAVQPKLALIRDLFQPAAKGSRPAATTSNQPSAPAPAAKPTTSAAAPALQTVAPTQAAAPAAAQAPRPTSADQGAANKDIESAVRSWAQAWASKDMGAYVGSYVRDYTPGKGLSHGAWEEERRKRILGKSKISVKISNLSISVKGNNATAQFHQDYAADAVRASSHKTLAMTKVGDRWLITRESSGG